METIIHLEIAELIFFMQRTQDITTLALNITLMLSYCLALIGHVLSVIVCNAFLKKEMKTL